MAIKGRVQREKAVLTRVAGKGRVLAAGKAKTEEEKPPQSTSSKP